MAERRRVYRVAERIREVLSQELLRCADPRLALVTVTSVQVSKDLRLAKVYWMVSGENASVDDTDEAFARAAGRFKSLLGKQLELRFVPELRFYYDDTLDTSERVEALLLRAQGGAKE